MNLMGKPEAGSIMEIINKYNSEENKSNVLTGIETRKIIDTFKVDDGIR